MSKVKQRWESVKFGLKGVYVLLKIIIFIGAIALAFWLMNMASTLAVP